MTKQTLAAVAENIEAQAEQDKKKREERSEKYPMCTRLSNSAQERSNLFSFLEWLASKDIELAKERNAEYGPELAPILQTKEALLMEYFEIDEKKLEEERRMMLDEQRKLNDKKT